MEQENKVQETIIPEEVEGTENLNQKSENSRNSNSDTDWIVKCLIIWILPIVGGLVFMNDKDSILQLNARRSLVAFALVVLLMVISSIGAYWIWILVAIYAIIKMRDKKPFELPLIDDICKKIWK